MSCETLLSLYLREFSSVVNDMFYANMVQFVLMFRDCLNIYGWQKKAESECKEFYGKSEYNSRLQERLNSYEDVRNQYDFTAINNAEFAPEIANELVTVYIDEQINGRTRLDRNEVIDLTQHLCHWLFQLKLTCSKLSMCS